MPVVPNNGKLLIELDGPDAVAELVETARRVDPAKAGRFFSTESRIIGDIGDHLFFLSATRPHWFEPYRDEAVIELADRLPMGVDEAATLLTGCSETAVEAVTRRLHSTPTSLTDLAALAGIGSESALSNLADHARRHPEVGQWLNRLGVHVPSAGPAVCRFTPHRSSLHAVGSGTDGTIGLTLDEVAVEADEITWHYLTFRPAATEGLPEWPHETLHLVSPRTYWFTLHAAVAADGRYTGVVVDDEGQPFDVGLEECEADPPPPTGVTLRPYDASLTYRNGHIHSSPGVCGTAGGSPVGIGSTPTCPGCQVLMFHGATIESGVREYGDGFRSIFYCERCIRVASTGTNWN